MTQPHNAYETSQDQAQQPGAPSAAEPRPPRDRKVLVMVTIALASLLFLAASGLLYLRWATMREPTCIFIVQAPAALRGAEVTVDGVKLLEPHTATIGVGERFAIPFYLDYGTYTVRVTLNGSTLLENQVELTPQEPAKKIEMSNFTPSPQRAGASTSRSSSPSSPSSSSLPPMTFPREAP